MRIINKNTGKIDYSQQEYHRLMYNYYCNPLSNPLMLYVFQRPTGLHDKSGIEIYEGDIIKHDLGDPKWVEKTWKVCFEFGSFQMRTEGEEKPISFVYHAFASIENDKIDSQDEYSSHLEIIGNIYDHPTTLTIKPQ